MPTSDVKGLGMTEVDLMDEIRSALKDYFFPKGTEVHFNADPSIEPGVEKVFVDLSGMMLDIASFAKRKHIGVEVGDIVQKIIGERSLEVRYVRKEVLSDRNHENSAGNCK